MSPDLGRRVSLRPVWCDIYLDYLPVIGDRNPALVRRLDDPEERMRSAEVR